MCVSWSELSPSEITQLVLCGLPSALMCCLDERFSPKPFLDLNYKYQTLEGEGQRSETPFLNEHFLPYQLHKGSGEKHSA